MPLIPFEAHRYGAEYKVRLRTQRLYTLDQAARALAAVLPEPPTRFGLKTAQEYLHTAAEQGVTGAGDEELSSAAQQYRTSLVALKVFPDLDAGEVPADWAPRKTPIVAKLRDGQWRVRLDPDRKYSLDQAARALALLPKSTIDRFGRNTAQSRLNIAAEQGITGDPDQRVLDPETGTPRVADPAVVAEYRTRLVALGVFPDPEAGPAAPQQ